jgi:uncharacterized membrane protein YqaE (UPF0057 family)
MEGFFHGQLESGRMRYIVALFLPGLAVLLCGRVILAVVLFLLQITLIGWLPAVVVAFFIINNHEADTRQNRLIRELRKGG